MRRFRWTLLGAVAAAGVVLAPIHAAARPAVALLQANPEPADAPAPKQRDGQIETRFQMMHESFLKRGKEGPIGVLFLGDSITEGWKGASAVWQEHFGKYDSANFGIGGDRTQHVLWRIENGELEGIQPKVVVLMIGTNNAGAYSAEEIARADRKIVEAIRQKLPKTKVLLLGIFPRGADPADPKVIPFREKIKAINESLAKLDNGKSIRYLDIGAKFMESDGRLSPEIMPDALHLSEKGYQIWADAIQPLLDEMMK
jgi:lysophospholipase L1-like esterase